MSLEFNEIINAILTGRTANSIWTCSLEDIWNGVQDSCLG
jgi:hypothetical protein